MTSSATDWRDPVPHSKLSKRQQEILQFLWNCPSPYSPSFREIGKAVGLKGPSAVRYQIGELERKGWVRRRPGHPRALEVRRPDRRLPAHPELPGTDYLRIPTWGFVPAGDRRRPCRSGTTIGNCPQSSSATDSYSSCGFVGTP